MRPKLQDTLLQVLLHLLYTGFPVLLFVTNHVMCDNITTRLCVTVCCHSQTGNVSHHDIATTPSHINERRKALWDRNAVKCLSGTPCSNINLFHSVPEKSSDSNAISEGVSSLYNDHLYNESIGDNQGIGNIDTKCDCNCYQGVINNTNATLASAVKFINFTHQIHNNTKQEINCTYSEKVVNNYTFNNEVNGTSINMNISGLSPLRRSPVITLDTVNSLIVIETNQSLALPQGFRNTLLTIRITHPAGEYSEECMTMSVNWTSESTDLLNLRTKQYFAHNSTVSVLEVLESYLVVGKVYLIEMVAEVWGVSSDVIVFELSYAVPEKVLYNNWWIFFVIFGLVWLPVLSLVGWVSYQARASETKVVYKRTNSRYFEMSF